MYDIRYDFINDEDANRLYKNFPKLKLGSDKYCPTCKNTRKYFWDNKNNDCDCVYQLQLNKHYLISGIGENYQRLDWPDFFDQENDNVVEAKKYVDKHKSYIDRGVGIIFYGSFGVGKTFAANMVVKELIKLGYKCFATTFANTVEQFTAGWKSIEDQRYFQKKFVYSDVLLLDDLGKEFKTSNNLPQTTFDNLLRSRVQAGKPTILTTNMDISELKDGYGGAVLSMLLEKQIPVVSKELPDERRNVFKRTMREIDEGVVRPIF